MVQLSKVSVLAVSMAVAVSGAFSEEARESSLRATQKQVVNVDLKEADADFERVLGSTNYNSYPAGKISKGVDRGITGAKEMYVEYIYYNDDDKGGKGGKGGKGSKGYYGDYYYHDDDKGGKGGKGSKGYYGDYYYHDDGKGGKGGKGSKGYYGDYYYHDDGKGGKGSKGFKGYWEPDNYDYYDGPSYGGGKMGHYR